MFCPKADFTNTLIQDIPIFNGNDATQLEDWLVDIETTIGNLWHGTKCTTFTLSLRVDMQT